MEFLKKWTSSLFQRPHWIDNSKLNPHQKWINFVILDSWLLVIIIVAYCAIHAQLSYAYSTQLPGEDASGKLEAAGILLKTLDTGIFKWGARIFAGLCIMSSAWALKEQRFGIAIICVIGAIIFGTAPKWVKNIFDIGDNQSLFSQLESTPKLQSFSTSAMETVGVNRHA
jgi:hypothetical protein